MLYLAEQNLRDSFSQRAEAIHSVIQSFCSKHSSIVDLVLDIERMASNQQSKSETDLLRHQQTSCQSMRLVF